MISIGINVPSFTSAWRALRSNEEALRRAEQRSARTNAAEPSAWFSGDLQPSA
jgi:hypothetical protein